MWHWGQANSWSFGADQGVTVWWVRKWHLLLLKDICGLYFKSFTIVIYYRNDSRQYYKTMITIISYAPSFA